MKINPTCLCLISDLILPVDGDHDVPTLLGAILCLRHSIPHLAPSTNKVQGLKDSFGSREVEEETAIHVDQIVKVSFTYTVVICWVSFLFFLSHKLLGIEVKHCFI